MKRGKKELTVVAVTRSRGGGGVLVRFQCGVELWQFGGGQTETTSHGEGVGVVFVGRKSRGERKEQRVGTGAFYLGKRGNGGLIHSAEWRKGRGNWRHERDTWRRGHGAGDARSGG
jgi:hypothetical protein